MISINIRSIYTGSTDVSRHDNCWLHSHRTFTDSTTIIHSFEAMNSGKVRLTEYKLNFLVSFIVTLKEGINKYIPTLD